MPAGQHQRGFEIGARPGPVVALEQQCAAPTEPGERLQLRFSRQLAGSAIAADDGAASPTGAGGELLGHRAQHREIRGVLARPGPPRWRRSARAVRRSPTSMWVSAEVRASHGSDAVAWAPRLDSARRSGRWSPLRTSGTANRRSRSDSNAVLPLRGGVVQGADGPVLVCPPARRRGVQLGHPLRALAVQVGEQVGPQQLLDAVDLAPRPGGRDERGLVLEPVEHASGVLPTGQLHGQAARHRVADADQPQELPEVLRQPAR